MFSKTIIGAAILALANAQKKQPKPDCRGEDLDGDGVVAKAAVYGYMPAMVGIGNESFFVGILGAEGADQDEILAFGKGLQDTADMESDDEMDMDSDDDMNDDETMI